MAEVFGRWGSSKETADCEERLGCYSAPSIRIAVDSVPALTDVRNAEAGASVREQANSGSIQGNGRANEYGRPGERRGLRSASENPTSDTHIAARRRIGWPAHSTVFPSEWRLVPFLAPKAPPPFHRKCRLGLQERLVGRCVRHWR